MNIPKQKKIEYSTLEEKLHTSNSVQNRKTLGLYNTQCPKHGNNDGNMSNDGIHLQQQSKAYNYPNEKIASQADCTNQQKYPKDFSGGFQCNVNGSCNNSTGRSYSCQNIQFNHAIQVNQHNLPYPEEDKYIKNCNKVHSTKHNSSQNITINALNRLNASHSSVHVSREFIAPHDCNQDTSTSVQLLQENNPNMNSNSQGNLSSSYFQRNFLYPSTMEVTRKHILNTDKLDFGNSDKGQLSTVDNMKNNAIQNGQNISSRGIFYSPNTTYTNPSFKPLQNIKSSTATLQDSCTKYSKDSDRVESHPFLCEYDEDLEELSEILDLIEDLSHVQEPNISKDLNPICEGKVEAKEDLYIQNSSHLHTGHPSITTLGNQPYIQLSNTQNSYSKNSQSIIRRDLQKQANLNMDNCGTSKTDILTLNTENINMKHTRDVVESKLTCLTELEELDDVDLLSMLEEVEGSINHNLHFPKEQNFSNFSDSPKSSYDSLINMNLTPSEVHNGIQILNFKQHQQNECNTEEYSAIVNTSYPCSLANIRNCYSSKGDILCDDTNFQNVILQEDLKINPTLTTHINQKLSPRNDIDTIPSRDESRLRDQTMLLQSLHMITNSNFRTTNYTQKQLTMLEDQNRTNEKMKYISKDYDSGKESVMKEIMYSIDIQKNETKNYLKDNHLQLAAQNTNFHQTPLKRNRAFTTLVSPMKRLKLEYLDICDGDKNDIEAEISTITIELNSLVYLKVATIDMLNNIRNYFSECKSIGLRSSVGVAQREYSIFVPDGKNSDENVLNGCPYLVEFFGMEGRACFISLMRIWFGDKSKTLITFNLIDFLTSLLEDGLTVTEVVKHECRFGDPSILLHYVCPKIAKGDRLITNKPRGASKKESIENLYKFMDKLIKFQPHHLRNSHAITAFFYYENLLRLPPYLHYCKCILLHLHYPTKDATLEEVDEYVKRNSFSLLARCSISCALLQLHGLNMSSKRLKEERDRIFKTLYDIETKLDSYIPPGINLQYEKKQEVGKFIQETLKLARFLNPNLKRTKTGRYKCDKAVLSSLRSKHEFVDMYHNWVTLTSRIDKFFDCEEFSQINISHYCKKNLDCVNFKGDWYFLESPTLRLSCTSPNLQCIPKGKETLPGVIFNPRSCFIPLSPDFAILSADYDCIELRICVRLMRNTTFKLIQKRNPFQIMFEENQGMLPPGCTSRNKLKTAIYENLYKFQNNHNYIRLLKDYGLNPEPWKNLFNSKEECTYVTTLYHNLILFNLKEEPSCEDYTKRNRRALNGVVQCSAAEVLHIAQFELNREIVDRGWVSMMRIVNSLHDELLFEVHKSILREACEMVENIMTKSSSLHRMSWKDSDGNIYEIPLFVNLKLGESWGELKNIDLFFKENL